MKGFIKKVKPGVTSQQLSSVEQKIVSTTPSPSPQPIPSSSGSGGGFVTPLVSQPAQPGDPSFVGPVQIEPTPSQPGDPSFVEPIQIIEPTPTPIIPTPQPGDPSFVGPIRGSLSQVKEYQRTSVIPEWASSQIIVPDVIRKVGAGQLYRAISYRKYLGLSTSDIEKQLERNLRQSKWFMSTQPIFTGDKTFEQIKKDDPALFLKRNIYGEFEPVYDYTRYKKESYEHTPSGFGKQFTAGVIGGVVSMVDPNYWGALIRGEGSEYLYQKEYETGKVVHTGDPKKIIGKWGELQIPYWENVIAPLATAGVYKYITAGQAVAKAGSLAHKGYKYFVTPATKVIQYGAIPTIIGTDIGSSIAYEQHGLVPSGTSLSKIGKIGLQFTMFGAGAKYWDTPSPRLTAISGNIKSGYQKGQSFLFKKAPGIETTYSKLSTFKDTGVYRNQQFWKGFKTNIQDTYMDVTGRLPLVSQIRTTIPSYKFTHGLTKTPYNIPSYQYPSDKPIGVFGKAYTGVRTFGYQARTKLFGVDLSKMPGTIVSTQRGNILAPFKTRIGFKPLEYKYYPDYIPTTLEQHLSDVQLKNSMAIRKDLFTKQIIKTKTLVSVDPKNPFKSTFFSKQIGHDRFTIGKIVMTGKGEGTATGVSYYKLSKGNLFYQEKPFYSKTSSKYLGEMGDRLLSTGTGTTITVGDSRTGTKALTIRDVMQRDLNLAVSKSYSTQQDIFAGDKYLKSIGGKYFFEQFKTDISMAQTSGMFRGKTFGGKFYDETIVFKPKLGTKDYFGETGGFDTSGLTTITKTDLVRLPGGFGTSTKQVSYPKWSPNYPQQIGRVSLLTLENWEAGIIGSSYWNIPTTKTTVKPSIKTDTLSKTIFGTFTIPSIKTVTAQDVKPLSLTSTISKQDTRTLTSPIQISKVGTTQIQKQIQTQIQQQKQQLETITIGRTVTPEITITHVPSYIPKVPPYEPPYKPPPYEPTYKPPIYPTPFPPFFPLLDDNGIKKGRRRKKIVPLGIGYRFREWKTLTMKEFLGGKG